MSTRVQRSSSARWSAATCCSSSATRSSSGVGVETTVWTLAGGSAASSPSPPPRSWPPAVLALARPAGQLLGELGGRQRLERLLDVLERSGTGRAARPAASARRASAGRGASAPRGARSATARGRARRRAGGGTSRPGCPARSRAAPSRGARGGRARPDLRLVVVDDGLAVRRLVAGEPERVQRERVLVGRRALLLDEAAEDPDLDGVGVHAANGSRRAGSAERAARRPAPRSCCGRPQSSIDLPAARMPPHQPNAKSTTDVEDEDDDQVPHRSLLRLELLRTDVETVTREGRGAALQGSPR